MTENTSRCPSQLQNGDSWSQASENSNPICKGALRSFRKKDDISDHIQIVQILAPHIHTHGIAVDTASFSKVKVVLSQQRNRVKVGK